MVEEDAKAQQIKEEKRARKKAKAAEKKVAREEKANDVAKRKEQREKEKIQRVVNMMSTVASVENELLSFPSSDKKKAYLAAGVKKTILREIAEDLTKDFMPSTVGGKSKRVTLGV
jgi:hypothetical protein